MDDFSFVRGFADYDAVAAGLSFVDPRLTAFGLESSAVGANANIKTGPVGLPKGKWIDATIDFREPEGDAFTGAVLESLKEDRTRKRSRNAQEEHYRLVREVLANAIRCHYHFSPPCVAYSRKADRHRGKAMARTVDLLECAGFLSASLGRRGTSSTFAPKRQLLKVAHQSKIAATSLTQRLPSERLIRQKEGGKNSQYVPHQDTAEAINWIRRLDVFNAFVAGHSIEIELTDDERRKWVTSLNHEKRQDGLRYIRPELFRTDLYRSFNHNSFEYGGRLYGAFWISTPSKVRPRLTIDGQPTAELDFKGCAVRMLYHIHGLEYRNDPYFLPLVAELEDRHGLERGHFREANKAMTQAVINAEAHHDLSKVPLPYGLSYRKGIRKGGLSRKQVVEAIIAKHKPIADSFLTGVGISLQRRESDLALSIITALMEQGVVALPVHDSFIVPIDKKELLRKTMNDLYKEMFGFEPEISC